MHLIASCGSDFHWTSWHARDIISRTNRSSRGHLRLRTLLHIYMGPHNFRDSYNAGPRHGLCSFLPPLLQLRHRAQDAVYPIKGILPSNICTHEYVSTFPSFSVFFLPFTLDISLIFLSYSTFPLILPFSSPTSFFFLAWIFIFKDMSLWSFSNIVQFYFSIYFCIIFPSLKSLFLIFFFYNWFIGLPLFSSSFRFLNFLSKVRFDTFFFFLVSLIYFIRENLLFRLNIIANVQINPQYF